MVGCYEDCTEAANLNRCMSATTKSAGDGKIDFFFFPPSFFGKYEIRGYMTKEVREGAREKGTIRE